LGDQYRFNPFSLTTPTLNPKPSAELKNLNLGTHFVTKLKT